MTLIKVDNDFQLYTAITNSKADDIIKLKPRTYFIDNPVAFNINHNLTIIGQFSNAKSTQINCVFVVGFQATFILKNLTIDYTLEGITTIALYDDSKLYGNNIIVGASRDGKFDTIYCKDSAISLVNSVIVTDEPDRPTTGLSLENSQMTAVNCTIKALLLKNSTGYLKDCLISYCIGLQEHSNLSYLGLAVDSSLNKHFCDFYIDDGSVATGINLKFCSPEPSLSITRSTFKNTTFISDFDDISWFFDDESTVLADDQEPHNDN